MQLRLKFSLLVFIVLLLITFVVSLFLPSPTLAPKIPAKHMEKPQAPVQILSSEILQLQEQLGGQSTIVLGTGSESILITSVSVKGSDGLLYSTSESNFHSLDSKSVKIPVTFLPMARGRYYLHFSVNVKSLSDEELPISHKSLAVIVQVGNPPVDIKLQKLSSGEHLDVLPAQEN